MSKIKSIYPTSLSFWIFLPLLLISTIFPQETEFQFDSFTIKLENKKMFVIENGVEIFSREFADPFVYLSDLDQDGNDELLVKDEINLSGTTEYILYVFNTLDNFFICGEINSGSTETYEIYSEDLEGLIIVAGNTEFNIYNKNDELKFLPVNCWKYEEGEVYLVNDLLYDPFIEENNNILSFIENIFNEEGKNCNTSLKIKSALVAGYLNYLNAGEKAIANHFLDTYYFCDDAKDFINELNTIYNKDTK